MSYFADMSAYTYHSGPDIASIRPGPPYFRSIETTAPRVNVGWLGRFHRHRSGTGAVPADTLEVLLLVISSQMINITRGTHNCHLCQPAHPGAMRLDWHGRTVSMGNGEIRIPSADGSLFAAPTLIGHYVAAHDYRPPAAFVHALIQYCDASSDDLALGWIPTCTLAGLERMHGMDLRPELLPPPVGPETLETIGAEIVHVAELFRAGDRAEADAIVASLNSRTGHEYELFDFLCYSGSRDVEDLAREAARPAWPRVPDITRAELSEIVRRIMAADPETGYYLRLLRANTPHPRVTDLIFHPPADLVRASAEAIVDAALGHRPIAL